MRRSGSSFTSLPMKWDMPCSTFSMYPFLVERKMPPISLRPTSCCSLARTRHDPLIGGAAYAYHMYVQNPQVTAPLAAFSDVHGAPAQRFFNLICLAYGANPTVFADVVDKGYLPKDRARGCRGEYDQVAYAFRDLIEPHVDQKLKRQVLDQTWLPPAQSWVPPETVKPSSQ